MNQLIAAAIAGFFGVNAFAQAMVNLRLTAPPIPGSILQIAETEASRVLSEANVRTRWNGRPHKARVCSSQAPDIHDIELLILDASSPKDHPGALGYSLPYARTGYRVIIFYDRIRLATAVPNPELLGHVIAHEVGHMLEGTLDHAPSGVMTARWTGSEIADMPRHPLHFTASDVDIISRRLDTEAQCERALEYVIASSRGE
jgi:hypothetical protein